MIKKVTKSWLKKHHACTDSLAHVIKNNYIGLSPIDFIKKLMSEDRFPDANWLIVRIMNKKQKVQYAVFAAEQVLDIYEKKYPNNKAPRLAIEAAKKYINNPCKITKKNAYAAAAASPAADAAYDDAAAAADAAADAAYAAAAAYDAAYAAAYDAAYDAAYAAAYAAAHDAAYADAYAAAAASDAAYADDADALKTKIINNGINILKGGA